MKIAVISSDPSVRGGIQRYTAELIGALESKKDARIATYFFTKKSELSKAVFAIKTLISIYFQRPDVILCAHIQYVQVCILAKRLFGIPYALFCYGIEVWDKSRNITHRVLFEQATLLIAISPYTRDQITEGLPQEEKKIRIISPCVDDERFVLRESSRKDLPNGIGRKHPLILSVCRLSASERYKGYDDVLSALPRVLEHFPTAVYVIVGSGDDLKRVRARIVNEGLSNHVILADDIADDDLPHVYTACDVFCMPSREEGFGIVFLEAICSGKPVIAARSAGAVHALLAGAAGELIEPGETEELATCLIKTLDGGHGRDPMSVRRLIVDAFGRRAFRLAVHTLLDEFKGMR
ncbi:MAG: glycosyltransferase family 4 protein [Patescibacteria group bacterium]